jgi:uncharacterized protein YigE (DUF2233 family)
VNTKIILLVGLLFSVSTGQISWGREKSRDPVCVSFSLKTHQLVLFTRLEDKLDSLKSVGQHLAAGKLKPLLLTNGPIFGKGFLHLGLLIRKSRELSPLNTRKASGNFFMKPNGVLMIKNNKARIVSTEQYLRATPKPVFAFQSGPLLLRNFKIHPQLGPRSKSRFTRSGIGLDPQGKLHVVLTRHPVSLYAFAAYFKDKLKCSDALYLDGAISGIATKEVTVNEKRTYASVLCVLPRKKSQQPLKP